MDEIRFGLVVGACCMACTRPTSQCACGAFDPMAHRPFGVHV